MPARFVEVDVASNWFKSSASKAVENATLSDLSRRLGAITSPDIFASFFLVSGMILIILHGIVVRLIAQKRLRSWREKRVRMD